MAKRRMKMICLKTGLMSKRFAPCTDCPHGRDSCPSIRWTKLGGSLIKMVRASIENPAITLSESEDGTFSATLDGREKAHGLKAVMTSRDGYRCLVCGSRENLTKDHVVPVVMGGNFRQYNLQTLCETCNALKGFEPCDYRFGRRFLGWREIWFDPSAAAEKFRRMSINSSNLDALGRYREANKQRAKDVREGKRLP